MDWSKVYSRNMKTAKEALESVKDLFVVKTLSKNVQWYQRLLKAKSGSNAKVEELLSNLELVTGLTKSLRDTVKKSLVTFWNDTNDQSISRYFGKMEWRKGKTIEHTKVNNCDTVNRGNFGHTG